jgi:hypothetical protein
MPCENNHNDGGAMHPTMQRHILEDKNPQFKTVLKSSLQLLTINIIRKGRKKIVFENQVCNIIIQSSPTSEDPRLSPGCV